MSVRVTYVPPHFVRKNETTTASSSSRCGKRRQLLLPEGSVWTNHHSLAEEGNDSALQCKRKRSEPPTATTLCVSTTATDNGSPKRSTSASTFGEALPLDIIGVVVDFYCADVNDAAELATISTSWREAVVASLMWTQRVEPITQRNPFPLLEREHLAWHWDCSDAVHLALLVEYIMNFWLRISVIAWPEHEPEHSKDDALWIWVHGPVSGEEDDEASKQLLQLRQKVVCRLRGHCESFRNNKLQRRPAGCVELRCALRPQSRCILPSAKPLRNLCGTCPCGAATDIVITLWRVTTPLALLSLPFCGTLFSLRSLMLME